MIGVIWNFYVRSIVQFNLASAITAFLSESLTVGVGVSLHECIVLQFEVQAEIIPFRTDIRGCTSLGYRLSRCKRLRVWIQVRGPNRSRRSAIANPPTEQKGKYIYLIEQTAKRYLYKISSSHIKIKHSILYKKHLSTIVSKKQTFKMQDTFQQNTHFSPFQPINEFQRKKQLPHEATSGMAPRSVSQCTVALVQSRLCASKHKRIIN